MKTPDLSPQAPELFVADDMLSACQGWQEILDHTPTEARDIVAKAACDALNDIDGFRGTSAVIVKSELAVVLKDPTPTSEVIDTAIKYGGVVVQGLLGRIDYVKVRDYYGLAWPLYDATVLAEPQIDPMADIRSLAAGNLAPQTSGDRRPVYLPVGFIDYAICAA